MRNLTKEQLSQLVSHYIREYSPEEIIPMIFEAVITQGKDKITLKWDNGVYDVFRKIRISCHGDNFVDILKIED